jgi:signal transduction histidine kinase
MTLGDNFILLVGYLLFVLLTVSLIVSIFVQKRRQQKYFIEKLQLQHQFQSELLQSRLEVQEQSFQYFSEEIHDNVGQLLSLIKYQLHKIGKKGGEPIQQDVAQSQELLGKAITDLRSISHTLNGNFVTQAGLKESLEKELNYVCSAKPVQCTMNISGEAYALPPEKELMIFRIIQESIANALKHAAPTHIQLHLHYAPDSLTIDITDNGTGFDTAQQSSGIGLSNMHTRTQLIGGTLHIQSSPNNGTNIHLTINTHHETANTHTGSSGR